jgi:hypothetical protein
MMQTFDAAQKAANILDRNLWRYFERMDRLFSPKVKSDLQGRVFLIARGCEMPVQPGQTPAEIAALFVLTHGDCMTATLQAVADDQFARDPVCQCRSGRGRGRGRHVA